MVVRVLKKTYDEIARTIGTLVPEQGGILGCSNPLGIIDRFEFDRHAKVGGAEYNPDTDFLDDILNDVWAEKTERTGFLRSW